MRKKSFFYFYVRERYKNVCWQVCMMKNANDSAIPYLDGALRQILVSGGVFFLYYAFFPEKNATFALVICIKIHI